MLTIKVTYVSHQGRVRLRNEDCLGVLGSELILGTQDVQSTDFDDHVLVVVADGLGGHPGGDVASREVVLTLARCTPADGAELRDAIFEANSSVFTAMKNDLKLSGMGSTVACLLIDDLFVVVANLGDSSVYVIDDGRAVKLSIDDVPHGASQLPGLPISIVTQVLGGHRVSVSISPHVLEFPLEGDASFLVCSDGLTNYVSLSDINSVLSHRDGLPAVQELLDLTLAAGAPDNVTIALVECRSTHSAAK